MGDPKRNNLWAIDKPSGPVRGPAKLNRARRTNGYQAGIQTSGSGYSIRNPDDKQLALF